MGFRVLGLGFRVLGLGLCVYLCTNQKGKSPEPWTLNPKLKTLKGLGFRVKDQDLGFRVGVSIFRVWGLGSGL